MIDIKAREKTARTVKTARMRADITALSRLDSRGLADKKAKLLAFLLSDPFGSSPTSPKTIKKSPNRGLFYGGRGRTRTCDLYDVNVTL